MWPEVQEQVAIEWAQIDQLLAAYRSVIENAAQGTPTFVEVSALATMLHSFYTGLENIFKRIASEIDDRVPSGYASHSDLLLLMASATPQRPAVISEALQIRLGAYLSFRHVFRHAYSFQLQWDKMQDLVFQTRPTWLQLQAELDQFFNPE